MPQLPALRERALDLYGEALRSETPEASGLAVEAAREVARLTRGDDDHAEDLFRYGWALAVRWKATRDPVWFEAAVDAFEDAVEMDGPESIVDAAAYSQLVLWHQRAALEPGAVDAAVSFFRGARDTGGASELLADILTLRYESDARPSDLDESITRLSGSLNGGDDQARQVWMLGRLLRERHELTGDEGDLYLAVAVLCEASAALGADDGNPIARACAGELLDTLELRPAGPRPGRARRGRCAAPSTRPSTSAGGGCS